MAVFKAPVAQVQKIPGTNQYINPNTGLIYNANQVTQQEVGIGEGTFTQTVNKPNVVAVNEPTLAGFAEGAFDAESGAFSRPNSLYEDVWKELARAQGIEPTVTVETGAGGEDSRLFTYTNPDFVNYVQQKKSEGLDVSVNQTPGYKYKFDVAVTQNGQPISEPKSVDYGRGFFSSLSGLIKELAPVIIPALTAGLGAPLGAAMGATAGSTAASALGGAAIAGGVTALGGGSLQDTLRAAALAGAVPYAGQALGITGGTQLTPEMQATISNNPQGAFLGEGVPSGIPSWDAAVPGAGSAGFLGLEAELAGLGALEAGMATPGAALGGIETALAGGAAGVGAYQQAAGQLAAADIASRAAATTTPPSATAPPGTTPPPATSAGANLLLPSLIGAATNLISTDMVTTANEEAASRGAEAAREAANIQQQAATEASALVTEQAATQAAAVRAAAAESARLQQAAAQAAQTGVTGTAATEAANLRAAAAESARLQQAAAQEAIAAQQRLRAPYTALGQTAAEQLAAGIAPGGQFARPFSMEDAQNTQAMRLAQQEAAAAAQQSAASRGGLLTAATQEALQKRAADIAAQYQNQAFNQYLAQQQLLMRPLEYATSLGAGQAGAQASAEGTALISAAQGAGAAGMTGAQQAANVLTGAAQQAGQFGMSGAQGSGAAGMAGAGAAAGLETGATQLAAGYGMTGAQGQANALLAGAGLTNAANVNTAQAQSNLLSGTVNQLTNAYLLSNLLNPGATASNVVPTGGAGITIPGVQNVGVTNPYSLLGG